MSMRTRIATVFAGIAVLFLAAARPALPHHSFAAEIDAGKPFTMTGVVTTVEWQNPPTFFDLDVTDRASGKVTNWALEMGSPNGLMREGWTRNTLKVGDLVSVEGSLARSGRALGNARVVTLTSTGKRLFAASSAPQ